MIELNERKLGILKAVVDDYIMYGLPIGSRTISKKHGIELSSATIRNEMSDLEELGFLEQPHTSAGRIPSQKAFRFYVDRLMRVAKLSPEEAEKIKSYFAEKMAEVNDVIEKTARVLSDTTHHISMVLRPQLKKSVIKRIQLVKLTEKKAILLLVTDSGLMSDTVIAVPEGITISHIEMLSNLLTDKLMGKTLDEAEADLRDCIRQNVCVDNEFITDIMKAIDTSVEPQGEKGIVLGGTQNIIGYQEYMSVEKARNFLSVLETKDMLYDLMKKATSFEFSVTIGQENELQELYDMSVVTATYKVGGKTLGSFGVIGPTRMDYSRVVSILGHVGNSLSEILSSFLETNGD